MSAKYIHIASRRYIFIRLLDYSETRLRSEQGEATFYRYRYSYTNMFFFLLTSLLVEHSALDRARYSRF